MSDPQIADRTSRIPGTLPRNLQGIVIAVIASLILVSSFCSTWRTQPKPPPVAATSTGQGEEVRRLQEFRKNLEAEQIRLQSEKERLALATQQGATTQPLSAPSPPAVQKPVDPFAFERRKREFAAPFASNIVFAAQRTQPTIAVAPPSAEPDRKPAVERQPAVPKEGISDIRESGKLLPPTEGGLYRLYEGTVIEAVLLNRLDSTFTGPVNCVVSVPVYSGRTIVVPLGTKLLGEARRVETAGQQRVAVSFHRLLLPNGYSVNLDQVPGLDQGGDSGLRDKVNNHYLRIFGASAMLGLLGGLSLQGTRYGMETDAADLYRQGFASSVGSSATRVLDRYLNILPTVTIREGHLVKVYLTRDLLLPDYRP